MSLHARRALLLLAPWPMIATCVVPRLRHENRTTAIKSAVYLVLFGSIVVVIALWTPKLLLPIAVLSGTATLVELWHAQPGWGTRRGLPPGRLSLVPVAAFLRHDHVERLFRRYGPIAKANLPRYTTPNTVCVKGLALGLQTLRQEESGSLRWPGIVYDRLAPAGFLRSMAPEDHNVYRRILRTALADHVVDACRPLIATQARATSALLAASSAGDPERRGVDVRPHLRDYALTTLCRLFLGVTPGTDEHALVQRLFASSGPLGEFAAGGEQAIEAGARTAHDLVLRRAASTLAALERGEHPPASFAAELAVTAPEFLDDESATMNLVAGCATAIRDVTGLLHWVATMLADAPIWQERARNDPSGEVASWIVWETLRLEQSEFIIRKTVEPVTVGGYEIPAGWLVRLCVRESHRDSAAFDDPDLFDPARFDRHRYKRSEYAPFGLGRHSCLGITTTMAVATELVLALTREHTVGVVSGGPTVYDHAHWRPSTRQRMELVPLVA